MLLSDTFTVHFSLIQSLFTQFLLCVIYLGYISQFFVHYNPILCRYSKPILHMRMRHHIRLIPNDTSLSGSKACPSRPVPCCANGPRIFCRRHFSERQKSLTSLSLPSSFSRQLRCVGICTSVLLCEPRGMSSSRNHSSGCLFCSPCLCQTPLGLLSLFLACSHALTITSLF